MGRPQWKTDERQFVIRHKSDTNRLGKTLKLFSVRLPYEGRDVAGGIAGHQK
jgi:hypothetical protein